MKSNVGEYKEENKWFNYLKEKGDGEERERGG